VDDFAKEGETEAWECVDDAAAPDDLATYIHDATPGDEVLFEMQDMSLNALVVFGQLINARVSKDVASSRTYSTRVKPLGGASTEVATRSTPGTFVYQQDVSETNPDTGDLWTPGQVNDCQPGLRIES
jgi:hypothetical protein